MVDETTVTPHPTKQARQAEGAALPVRQVSRLSSEMHLSGDNLVRHAVRQPFDRAIVLLVVMRVCAPDWASSGTLSPPGCLTRFVSVNSIAASLHRPFETVRRHINALVDAKICVAGPSGIALAPRPPVSFDPIALFAGYHDITVGFAEDVGRLGLLPPPCACPAPSLRLCVVQTALDIALLPFERIGTLFDDWATLRVWAAIGVLNVRHVMLDAELDERYAVASTPDDERRPVSLRTVSRMLAMPYSTTWRHAQQLSASDLAAEVDGGWLVGRAHLREERMEEQVVESVLYYVRRLAALTRAGLDPTNARAGYLVGKPPLTPER